MVNRCLGVIPPKAMFGHSWVYIYIHWVPLPTVRISADKLSNALLLCMQAGLLSGESAYRRTAMGRRRLR